ncbi:MAG: UvrD-helicase domain-containing protein [Campylobacterota bacterium]
MNLTQEQKDIINSKHTSFKINAVAGSGKTTTLLEYAKQKDSIKILYLAYNKSLQQSVQKKLISLNINNIKVSTIHSLAYNKIQAYRYKLCHELKVRVIEKVLGTYEQKVNQRANYFPIPQYIALIKDLVSFYCNSSLIDLDLKLIESYKKYSEPSAKTLELINKDTSKVLAHLKFILSSMKNRQIDATHDFYLKLFYLNKKISSNLGYDLILVDEAQDISDVMIGIVESQNCNRVYVGDSFQQIYSFRYAMNALNKIELPAYNLTKSFRFSNSYAKELEKNINELYKQNSSKPLFIKGNEHQTNFSNKCVNRNKQFAIIARTTFGLVQELVHYIHKNKKLYFEGGYGSYSLMNQTVYSIFYLKEKKNEKIALDEIKEFETIKELEQFAKDTKNQDYLNIIKFINTYGDNIFEINNKVKSQITLDKNEADIIFTTTHKSKGLQYNQVVMADDFITKKDIVNPKSNLSHVKINEELNIYYVASTRVKDAIELASFKLEYKYNESDFINKNSENTKPKYTKKTSHKKMKQLQEKWLKNNKIKKVEAF